MECGDLLWSLQLEMGQGSRCPGVQIHRQRDTNPTIYLMLELWFSYSNGGFFCVVASKGRGTSSPPSYYLVRAGACMWLWVIKWKWAVASNGRVWDLGIGTHHTSLPVSQHLGLVSGHKTDPSLIYDTAILSLWGSIGIFVLTPYSRLSRLSQPQVCAA